MHFALPTLHVSDVRLIQLKQNIAKAVQDNQCDLAVLKSFERKHQARLSRAGFILGQMPPRSMTAFRKFFLGVD